MTFGSELLANVVNGPRPLAADAAPNTLVPAALGGSNIDPTNSNRLRGGFGKVNNHNGYRNTRDEEMFEEDPTAQMRGSPDDPEMPMRGARCDPAATCAFANGAVDAPLDADSLLKFLDAALSQFDATERERFFAGLSDEFFARHEVDLQRNGTGDTNGTPQQLWRKLRVNGNATKRYPAPAQDRSLKRIYDTDFFERLPDARRIVHM